MKDNSTDILRSSPQLKKMPYEVPDGYFLSLEEKINSRTVRAGAPGRSIVRKLAPYFATAAMFLIMVTAGTFFLRTVTDDGDYTFEDYLVMSDGLTGMITYTLGEDQYAEASPDEYDIAEYLIYTGVSTGAIEFSYK